MTHPLLAPQEPLAFPVVTEMADPDYFDLPLFSCSGAKRILEPSCPALFAWEATHPRPDKRAYDMGHVAHELILGKGNGVHVIDADDWRKADTKAAGKAARERGQVPLLRDDFRIVAAMRQAMRRHPILGSAFTADAGRPEVVLMWHDEQHGVNRKCKLDFLPNHDHDRPVVLLDYKTADQAAPTAFARSAANYGYHQQHAWYTDAVRNVLDIDAAFVFAVQSKQPPYLITLCELDPPAVDTGRAKNDVALQVYAECVATGEWPGFASPHDIVPVSLPAWADRQY